MILAIDPGNIESGVVIIDEKTLRPCFSEKMNNEELIQCIYDKCEPFNLYKNAVIEKIQSYGMPVGIEVFDTCIWIGRFKEAIYNVYPGIDVDYIYRKDEKINLCRSMKANDTTIKQALVDRFAPGEKNYGKGTKKEPGWFFGFAKDIWAAYAVGVTYYDMYLKGEEYEN